ncbi:MAG: DNA methyltransferase, partial [Chloroflexota bacterium]
MAHLRILDPACGSGSFLLGAYQYLLNWHLKWYTEHETQRARPELRTLPDGSQRLTIDVKKRILRNNLYGVDIDAQAVEVTKLSLLLKVLEGETEGSLGVQLAMFRERALPDLGANIQCGNSLIGYDYPSVGNADEWERVNPFDWQAAFPVVFAAGGFDAVIGNPPYVRQETLGTQKGYFSGRYRVYHGIADLYAYFIERGIS